VRTATLPSRKFEEYENKEAIAWVLDPLRLRAMFKWWLDFEAQQEHIRRMYKERDQVAPFTRSLTMSKEGGFMASWRIPSRIDEILLKLDPELDGQNMRKMNAFLRDYPVFDLRMRKSR
jgi:hypothetical protein